MADIPTLEAADSQSAASAPRSLPWLWISIAALVLLGGGGVAGWLLFARGETKPDASTAQHAAAAHGPALYVALDPPFVTNFEAEQLVRFLQVTVQVMTSARCGASSRSPAATAIASMPCTSPASSCSSPQRQVAPCPPRRF